MARLWHLVLLGWSWIPLCLTSGETEERLIGTPDECKNADFVPGHNLGGEGFDIVKMERRGAYIIDTEKWERDNGTCTLHRNSYLGGKKQKVPVAVVDWRALQKCVMKVSGTLYDSAESLVNDSTSAVINDWKIGLEIPVSPANSIGVGFGGSRSNAATFAMQKSKQDRYTFLRHAVHCNFYTYRLATDPPLNPEFVKAMKSLPAVYSEKTEPAYRNLIDTYGTHYIMQMFLGGEMKAITAIKTCQATMSGLTETEIKDCLEVEASATLKPSVRVQAMYKHCMEKKKKLGSGPGQSFSSMFNERIAEVIGGNVNGADLLFHGESNPNAYSSWLGSLKNTPDVVRYALRPLHAILQENHPARAGLKKAVERYIIGSALVKKCSESCKIGHRSSARDRCACVCNRNENIKSNCCPAGKGLATLEVSGLSAVGLYGDIWTKTDGSVVVRYGHQVKRTSIIWNNDNPKWPEIFEFGPVSLNMATKLKFRVYDADSRWNSDLLGECSFDPRSGKRRDSCMFDHGTFFFSYTVVCAPSLGGPRCGEYIPTPMDPSLAKVFHTRNGVLAGESRLQWFNSTKQSRVEME